MLIIIKYHIVIVNRTNPIHTNNLRIMSVDWHNFSRILYMLSPF